MGEAEFLKEQMASAKAAPAPSVKNSISSYLFGTKSTPAPTPLPVPPRSSTSDAYDYTAEARRKRSAAKAAKPALDIKESISNISSGIGQKLSNLKGGAAVTASKTDEVVKKTPELSEYEKQIMAGTSLDTFLTCIAVKVSSN